MLSLTFLIAPAGVLHAQDELADSLSRLPPVFGQPQLYQRNGKEDIYRIARRFGVSASAIHNANTGDLKQGDELLVIPTEHIVPARITDGIAINLTERGLYLYRDGSPIHYFPVAIGMQGWETPTGEFTIANKARNPTWFPPSWAVQEEPVPPGPENPLGDRWMGLSAKGYGLHATNRPSTVGRYASHGCMRMYPEQARQLFDLVKVGTPVTIVYRRIVFGYRPETSTVYMAYHPDPYEIGDIHPEDVTKELQEYGLDAVVDIAAVQSALERPSGTPVPIIGSATHVLVNGTPVRFALGPTRAGSDWLVPAGPLTIALRARIEMSARRDYLVIVRGGVRLFFVPGSTDMLVNGQSIQLDAAPQLAVGYPLIPLKATVTALGGSVGWDETPSASAGDPTASLRANKLPPNSILIWDGWGMVSSTLDSPADNELAWPGKLPGVR